MLDEEKFHYRGRSDSLSRPERAPLRKRSSLLLPADQAPSKITTVTAHARTAAVEANLDLSMVARPSRRSLESAHQDSVCFRF